MSELSREATAIESLFYIQTKEGGAMVPYTLNNAQRFLDSIDRQTGHLNLIIAKARQKGFSSILLAKFDIRCMGREGTHAVTISHEGEATTRLFDRAHFYLNHMNGPPPVFGRNSRNETYFKKTESTFYIGTAGAKAFGRGDTITDLHCSEYAWWDDPLKHSTGLFQAVPHSGRIYLESTGNGRKNDFYYIWKHADGMGFERLFYPWFADTEYSLPLPPHHLTWKPDIPAHNAYMMEMRDKYHVNDRMMYWYEMKLGSLREDVRLMQQEYPFEPEECFQATGGSIFGSVTLNKSELWIQDKVSGWYIYKLANHPIPGFHYVIGGDPSGGTGNDAAAMIVICAETGEQVLELSNNTINPLVFGRVLVTVGNMYNKAFIVCESNNHGAAVIPYLKENYPKELIYKIKYATGTSPAKYGWMNSRNSKHVLVGTMLETMDAITIYGKQTITELEGFEENENGTMEGDSDNLVIALGLAMLGYKKFEHYRLEYERPIVIVERPMRSYMTYTLEEVLDNLNERRGSDRLRSHVGMSYPYN